MSLAYDKISDGSEMVKNLILTTYSGRLGAPIQEEIKRRADSKAGRRTRPCLSSGSEYNVEFVSFNKIQVSKSVKWTE